MPSNKYDFKNEATAGKQDPSLISPIEGTIKKISDSEVISSDKPPATEMKMESSGKEYPSTPATTPVQAAQPGSNSRSESLEAPASNGTAVDVHETRLEGPQEEVNGVQVEGAENQEPQASNHGDEAKETVAKKPNKARRAITRLRSKSVKKRSKDEKELTEDEKTALELKQYRDEYFKLLLGNKHGISKLVHKPKFARSPIADDFAQKMSQSKAEGNLIDGDSYDMFDMDEFVGSSDATVSDAFEYHKQHTKSHANGPEGRKAGIGMVKTSDKVFVTILYHPKAPVQEVGAATADASLPPAEHAEQQTAMIKEVVQIDIGKDLEAIQAGKIVSAIKQCQDPGSSLRQLEPEKQEIVTKTLAWAVSKVNPSGTEPAPEPPSTQDFETAIEAIRGAEGKAGDGDSSSTSEAMQALANWLLSEMKKLG